MKFRQKSVFILEKEIHAGGSDHLPPTDCPRPARASAYTPAHVERTGRPATKKIDDMRTVRPVQAIGPILSSELTT